MCRAGRSSNEIRWTKGQRKSLRKEGYQNSEHFGKTDIVRGGCSVLVLSRGRERQEDVSEWYRKGRVGTREG